MARKTAAVTKLRPDLEPASRPLDADRESVERWLAENKIRRIRIGGFDLDGIFRGKIVSSEKLLSSLDGGFGFCDVIFGWDSTDTLLEGLDVTGWHTGYPDTLAKIDTGTRRTLPWDEGTGLFLADFWQKGDKPLAMCPRNTLKRVLARVAEHGAGVKAGFEYEFFFFRETSQSLRAKGYRNLETLSPGMFGYSVVRASEHAQLVNEVFDSLSEADIGLEGMHTETGPGVYECAIRYQDALEAADRAALFKTCVKEIAARHGLTACFMAKWNPQLPGCSGHVHLSLWDEAGGHNRFAAKGGLSAEARCFIGGMLNGTADYLPLVAPTINSYKRLVPNTWAPTTATWGVENRTTAIRAIHGGEKSTRLEFRLPGADANPYLALAAALAMGVQGIERKEKPAAVIEANAYERTDVPTLPTSLQQATERFAASERAREILGDEFVRHFAATRRWECRLYQEAVTDWELSRYFETV